MNRQKNYYYRIVTFYKKQKISFPSPKSSILYNAIKFETRGMSYAWLTYNFTAIHFHEENCTQFCLSHLENP